MPITEKATNNSDPDNADSDWLEKALLENYVKYYDYDEFDNREEIISYGSVSRANWKDSDNIMALKYSCIKELVNEVSYNYKHCIVFHCK